MKKLIVILCSVVVLSACASKGQKMQRMAAENSQKITQLRMGMTQAELVTLMGTKSLYSLSNPIRAESFKNAQGKTVQVLSYCTQMGHFGRCNERDITPVILQNDRVTGWGRSQLRGLYQDTGGTSFSAPVAEPAPATSKSSAP